MKTKIQGALKVAKNALHSAQMRLPRVMHVEAHLLDSISNIWTSKSEILKSTSNTAVGGGVGDGSSIGRKLGMSIHRGAARLAAKHTSTVKNVQNILTL
jgi:hypothetical protein